MRRLRSIAFAAFAACVLAQIVVVTPALQADEPQAPPAPTDVQRTAAAAATEDWATAAKRAVAEGEYEITLRNVASAQNAERSYRAPNRAHNLRSHFTQGAVRIIPRTDEGSQWELSFSLVGYGRGADVRPVDSPTLAPRGKKGIDYRRGRLTEWYVNDERGLEQGFTLSGPPEELHRAAATRRVPGRRTRLQDDGEITEPAFVALKLGGDLVPTITPDGQAIDFAPRGGGPSVLRYAELIVVDALGKELPARMEGFSEAGVRGIRLVFDDSDAVYPVVVDPLATNASWTGEENMQSAAFGWTVAGAGDVNKDGFDDVVVGAPYFDGGNGAASGAAFVYHGSPSGLSTTADWSTYGFYAGDLLGVSVASAGNVNGSANGGSCAGGPDPGLSCTVDSQCFPGGSCEGYDDVIIAAPGYPYVWVYYGGPNGLSSSAWLNYGAPVSSQSGYGHSVASAGDVNRDGFGDIVIGAPFHDCVSPSLTDCGIVYVYHGSATGLPAAPSATPSWTIEGNAAGAQLGWTVAGGDVGGTIDSDLILHAPGTLTAPVWVGAEAFVYLGSDSGLGSTADWTGQFEPKPDLWVCSVSRDVACTWEGECSPPQCPGCVGGETCVQTRINLYTEAAPETFRQIAAVNGGVFVAATGDVNGDGKGDWAVGSPYDIELEGRVDVYYGTTTSSLPATPSWSVAGIDEENLGWSVAGAGDTNGDGIDDLLIGAANAAFEYDKKGLASVHLGSTSGLTDDPGWTVGGGQSNAWLGFSLDSAGDVNGDGIGDVIVGAVNAQRGQYLEGLANVYLGSAGLTPLAVGEDLGFTVLSTRAELQDFGQGVLSAQLASEAVGFGPVPGSLLLSTGRAADGGLGSTDWGDPGVDKTIFDLSALVPSDQKTFCFTSQFITSESDPSVDKAFFCFDRDGGACSSPVHDLSALATGTKNAPVSHCIDVEGKASLFLHFEVTDGGTDGLNDSAVILSRLYFSELPLPADVMDETTPDGYFQNPAPQDISRLAGTYSYTKSLLSVRGVTLPFDFTVFYDSGSTSEGVLGPKWSHSYEGSARRLWDGDDAGTLPDSIQVRVGTRAEYFAETPEGLYEPQFGGSASRLTYVDGTDRVTYVTQDRVTHVFDRLADDNSLKLASSTDERGGQLQFYYDSMHRLTSVLDTRGEWSALEHTPDGLLRNVRTARSTGQKNLEATFEYDAGTGVLSSITDLDGKTTTFTSTADGLILTGTDADGVTFVSNSYETFDSIAVDQQGVRIASRRDDRDPDLHDTETGMELTYEGDKVVTTDRLVPARRQTRQYDAKGRVAAHTDPTGVRMEYAYDRNNNRTETRRKLPSGTVDRVVDRSNYDGRGNLIRKVDFPSVCINDPNSSCTEDRQCPGSTCGVVSANTFDQNDNLRSITDHHGNTTILDYDPAGNLTRERDPLGNENFLTYDRVPGKDVVAPRPVSMTDARGFVFTSAYDADGYLVRATDAVGGTVTHTWDAFGRRTSTTDPLGEADSAGGHRTCFDYDDMGRETRVRVLCGTPSEFVQRSMTYDAEGRVLSQIAADGAESRIVYTSTGQPQTQINPLGQAEHLDYDLADRITRIDAPSPSGRAGPTDTRVVTTIDYDAGDRLNGLTESYGLCVGGDPSTAGQACTGDPQCLGGGRCGVNISAEYDEIGNLVRLEDPRGGVRRFEYDLLGRIVAHGEDTDDDGSIDPDRLEGATYDGRGLETSRTTPRGHIITYSYDAAARGTGMSYGSHDLSHVLDPNGSRVLSVLDGALVNREFDPLNRLSRRTDEFGNQVDAVRDLAGRLTELVYPSDLDGDGQRDRVYYGYDDLHRLTSVFTDWDGNRTTYGYDQADRLTRATLPDGSVVTYSYDAAGRLTGISDPGGAFSASYTLNGAGVQTAATVSLPLEPSIPDSDVDYTYGPHNELLSSSTGATFTYDDSGNMVSGAIAGAPVEFAHNAINQLESVNDEIYRYDADGLRVETNRNGTARRYVYDMFSEQPRMLEEQDDAGNVVSRYVHGIGLISRTGPEGLRVYHYDSRGSTVSLTTEAGLISDAYAYDPFGRPAGHAGNTIQPFRYNGRDGVFDDDNGLYYMRARYYAPELQRFIQTDQAFQGALTDTQSLNRYAFVEGDPINRIDPEGEFGWIAAGALVGGLVGGIVNVAVECLDGCSLQEGLGAAAEGIIAGAVAGAVITATGGAGYAGVLGAKGVIAANIAAGAGGAFVGSLANTGVQAAFGEEVDVGDAFKEAGIAAAFGAAGGAVAGIGVNSKVAQYSAKSAWGLKNALQGSLKKSLYGGSKLGLGKDILKDLGRNELGLQDYATTGEYQPFGYVKYFASGGKPYPEVFGWTTPWGAN